MIETGSCVSQRQTVLLFVWAERLESDWAMCFAAAQTAAAAAAAASQGVCVHNFFFYECVFGCVARLDRLWLWLFFVCFLLFLTFPVAVLSAQADSRWSFCWISMQAVWPVCPSLCWNLLVTGSLTDVLQTSAESQSEHLCIWKQDVWCFASFGSEKHGHGVKFLKGFWIVNISQGFFFSLSPAPCVCRNRCIRLI